jgi:hypothetical protein
LAQIAAIESRLSRGYGSAAGVSSHFRPLLVQVVSAELARKHGVVLEKQPERAQQLLGPRLRQLLDPATTLSAPLGAKELGLVIEEVEQI